jgi:DNA (cytosine-5)-methyltransferase 1
MPPRERGDSPLRAVSLFSNCGAGDTGYARAGFSFEVLAEIDERRLRVARLNHPEASTVLGDLCQTWRSVVETYRARCGDAAPALLAACPPCQGMSSARSARGDEDDAEAGSRDERNLLVTVIAKAVKELRPRVCVVENVPAFLTRRVKHPRTGKAISAALLLADAVKSEYRLYPLLCDLADYGVPQHRERIFLTFVRRDDPVETLLTATEMTPYPTPTHGPDGAAKHVALREALKPFRHRPLDSRSRRLAGKGRHSVPVFDEHRYVMIAAIPKNSGGGAWTNSVCPRCGEVEVGEADATCPVCSGALARPTVYDEESKRYRLIRGFRSSSYTRMRPDVPAATVTTASGNLGSDKTIHPWENRVLSPAECAQLQTLPKDFKWGDTLALYGTSHMRAMIGEAVPPRFTQAHGRTLRAFLTAVPSVTALRAGDTRVAAAEARLARARTSLRAADQASDSVRS